MQTHMIKQRKTAKYLYGGTTFPVLILTKLAKLQRLQAYATSGARTKPPNLGKHEIWQIICKVGKISANLPQ
eukprot:4728558-Amphidinium_carterae.2